MWEFYLMIPRLKLTPEQLAYAKARYLPFMRGPRSLTALAKELGVSRDGLRRHIDPEFRARRNASAVKCQGKKYVRKDRQTSTAAKYAIARAKVTLVPVNSMDK